MTCKHGWILELKGGSELLESTQHQAVLMSFKRGGGYPPAISHCLTHAQAIKAVASEASAPVYVQTLQQRAGFSLHAHSKRDEICNEGNVKVQGEAVSC